MNIRLPTFNSGPSMLSVECQTWRRSKLMLAQAQVVAE
jgi:hypothetical protein